MSDEPRAITPEEEAQLLGEGDDAAAFIDLDNNEMDFLNALERINQAMDEGWSYERAVLKHGVAVKGHPFFKEFWPETRYWGDAAFFREKLGLPLDR